MIIVNRLQTIIEKIYTDHGHNPRVVNISTKVYREVLDEMQPIYAMTPHVSNRNNIILFGTDFEEDPKLPNMMVEAHVNSFIFYSYNLALPESTTSYCFHEWKIDFIGDNTGHEYRSCKKCGKKEENV